MREEMQLIENGIFSLDFQVFVKNIVGCWLKNEYNSK